jgi:hypothetical protein
MTKVTRILSAIERGDPQAAEELLPLVYDELRRLATQRLSQEKPGQTLQATALVHEAYLRLVGDDARSGGTGVATSSGPPRRQCGESSSSLPAARGESAMAGTVATSPSTSSTSQATSPRNRSWTWTKRCACWRIKNRRSPRWSSHGISPG